jgi:NADH-quinone oxidoreductase subunit J
MALQIIFVIVAAVTLGAALMVVTVRNLVHSALWLILALFGVAVVYGLLQAGFLAVVQVVIYIGAIAILFIFAVMLTRNIASDNRVAVNENWPWALLIALVVGAALIFVVAAGLPGTVSPPEVSERFNPVQALGIALVSPDGYVLAFELASVLLLAALIGALVVAWERK